MDSTIPIVSLAILLLLSVGVLPSAIANSRVLSVRRFVTCLVGITMVGAIALLIDSALSSRGQVSSTVGSGPLASLVGAYVDGTASLMLLLVTFIGLVICRFSVRYLEGELRQGDYFRWLGFTLGAVSLMIISGNLMLFVFAWVLTSLGLHQLLLHYRNRYAAHRAAWTKFVISRTGDCLLLAALVLTFQTFGTFELAVIFEQVSELNRTTQLQPAHMAISWLLVLAAVTKSAQFPFHSWLPDTMETPTPVSALMHAGIVNAGGYLIIRMSPVISLAPASLQGLVIFGAVTTGYGGLVMMTQPTIKRALAYSTVAQMGFMMIQCGLGAYSAAMLHILAHSLYKAHAFLNSGSVVSQRIPLSDSHSASLTPAGRWTCLLIGASTTLLAYFGISLAVGIDQLAKPGGVVLAFVLCLALTTWGSQVFILNNREAWRTGVLGLIALGACYLTCYLGIQYLMGPTEPASHATALLPWVSAGVIGLFVLLFALHLNVVGQLRLSWLEALRIHAVNGFYVDAIYQRVFHSMVKS